MLEATAETKVSPILTAQEISGEKEMEKQLGQCICIDESDSEVEITTSQKVGNIIESISSSNSSSSSGSGSGSGDGNDLSSLNTDSVESVQIMEEEGRRGNHL